jgi:hypothetical protein
MSNYTQDARSAPSQASFLSRNMQVLKAILYQDMKSSPLLLIAIFVLSPG